MGKYELSKCPLCASKEILDLYVEGSKAYRKCAVCHICFLSPESFLSQEEEYAHYLTHENCPDDPGYQNFLGKLTEPLLEKLSANSSGLDYGCGPGPALAKMMEGKGHQMSLYDPFFFPAKESLSRQYDFVTCTETAEHFHAPGQEFKRLASLLKPRGWLAIMTCFQTDDDQFASWHYRLDPTHVVFYRSETFEWLAGEFGLSIEIPRKDVVLLQRPETS